MIMNSLKAAFFYVTLDDYLFLAIELEDRVIEGCGYIPSEEYKQRLGGIVPLVIKI